MQAWHRRVWSTVIALGALVVSAGMVAAQGVSTGAAAGVVTDQSGAPLAGVTVELIHQPTGFRTVASTNDQGAWSIQGLEPGGPYIIRVRHIGYRAVSQERIYITLGQTFRYNAAMEATPVEVEGITVTADPLAADFAPTRQGTQTTITTEQLENLPTLDRRFTDFAKLTPQIVSTDANSGLGLSVVGQNNRFNTIQIDGSTVNDRFGLGATGSAGGQANGKPIGYEAVKEYQVELAPYDVRQGNFTGALINAVTKNGTNEFTGSAFGYFRNQGVAGDPLSDTEFKNWQFGGSLGGPIVRDKAHFFVDAEFQRASTPATGPFIGSSGIGGVVPNQGDLDAFNQALTSYGLPTGSGGSVSIDNPLTNLTGRVDYNIWNNNRLVFRYSYNRAQLDNFSRTTSTSNPGFRLDNNGYEFTNKTHNPSLQLFSNFSNGSSNEFRVSYNRLRDARDPNVVAPQVRVNGFTSGADSYGIVAGSEQFSQGNRLNQDIWELTDNYTFPDMKQHRITVGTRNELYKVYNLFAQSSYGVWTFDDLTAFQTPGFNQASSYTISGQRTGGDVQAAEFTAATIGAYAQDQWQVTPTFSLTYGLRVDIPVFFDQPTYDAQVTTDGFNTKVPSGQILFNPRAGFNWDVDGLGTQQVRGGVGIFTGNPAYVWMSNAYSNNGTGLSILSCGATAATGFAPAFSPDNTNQPTFCVDGTGAPQTQIGAGSFLGEVDVIGKDTKYPQVFRANLAYDRRLPEDIVFTAEGIYNKGINDYFIVNQNLQDESSGLSPTGDGRLMYGMVNTSGRGSPLYFNSSVYGVFDGGLYELNNTSKNYSYNITGQLRKQFGRNLSASIAYTYSKAKDVQSFTSSRAISNWRFGRVNSGSQFNDEATTSSFDRPHKITISGTYTFPWERWGTQLSLIYIGQSGTPYTYIAGGSSGRGDLNADGTGNDPLYVIRNASDPMMTFNNAADAQAYDTFISSLPCLNKQRGTIMERNSCRNPFQHFLDVNLRQSLPAFSGNKLTLEVGVFNFLNLINNDWGIIKTAGGGVFDTQSITSVTDASAAGIPNHDYTGPANKDETYVNNGDNRNSWQLQFALRYEYGRGLF